MLAIITEKLCTECGTELHGRSNRAMYLCKDNYYCVGCVPEGADYKYIAKPKKIMPVLDEKSSKRD